MMSSHRSTDIGPLKSRDAQIAREASSHPTNLPQAHSRLEQSSLQIFFHDAVEATNPPLRHLASHSSLGSIESSQSHHTSKSHSSIRSDEKVMHSNRYHRFVPLAATFEDQRAGSNRGVSITSNTRPWNPDGPVEGPRQSFRTGKSKLGTITVGDGSGSLRLGSTTSIQAGKDKEAETGLLNTGFRDGRGLEGEDASKESLEGQNPTDEAVYPGPLGLTILITGIALSVFLISTDRTIITTAIPYITSAFDSTSDIGWYGSSYLLTASAFQPLYGRIYMLFDMKWSYLIALFLFQLGSLICGVAPTSVTLIIGRAIAGLGSAGILTGSFVVVSHAVPLHQRPILTAVVGLMFGVGATVGPLLGGVFTDLVTWRWCFYFNLPVGGATAGAMVFFFHPPKNHGLMGKSIIYRIMELDLVGNVILLGACIMLFLALQLTEERHPWGSPEVVGLLSGAGMTFIIFTAWQWWKADGALMPPRILRQKSVAASCAAAFFIYSAILIHTYYLPIWFQAVKGASAIHSGVNMIPYVAANAIVSLLAGIFVSKNGYFTAPAIIGCAIGTLGCGLLSTIDANTSTAKWVGYEILASAGIGMAIQQGFTAVQIVLPLNEVAIGTAAVVAFQSLGGAIFVSVGNTILQNSLYNARLPGVDVDAILDAGAAHFREHAPTDQIPALVGLYDSAMGKVFTAAIPMAGLAMVSCFFLEWRSVKDKNKSEDEEKSKSKTQRGGFERKVLESHRQSFVSTNSAL